MKKQFSGSFSYKKDIGKVRDSNEDDTKVVVNSKSDVLMVVADGMGGCLKGEFASSKIVEYLTTSFLESPTFLTTLSIKNWISKKLKKVNKLIYNKSFKEPEFHVKALLMLNFQEIHLFVKLLRQMKLILQLAVRICILKI